MHFRGEKPDTSHDRPGHLRILQELPLRFTVLCADETA
jgi:hypothetical protein